MVSEHQYNLREILKVLKFNDSDKRIEFALSIFQKSYQEIPNKYPGDDELYQLFKRCILQGLSIEQSFLRTKEVIEREIYLCKWANQIGLKHFEHFFP